MTLANDPTNRTNAAIKTHATDIQSAAHSPADIEVSATQPMLRRGLGEVMGI
jgi:hypothetical protein